MKQSKTTKNAKRSPKRALKLSPLKLFFMKKLKHWLDEPGTRQGRSERKHSLAKYLGKDIQTLKNMYLYGQGSLDDWMKTMDHISVLKQETIIQLYDSYPFLMEKLEALNEEQIKLHRHTSEMTEPELALINKLIEAGLTLNKIR